MATPEIRFPEFTDQWEETTIAECCTFTNGKAHEQDIDNDGQYIVVNSKFISTEGDVKKYSNSQVEPLYKDDIVMVMSDLPNGKALAKCYLIETDGKYTLNQRICALRTQQNAYFLKNAINRNPYFLRFDDGVKQTNLKKDEVTSCPLYLPTEEEQTKIAHFLMLVDKKIALQKNIVDDLEQQKASTMKKIFSQEIKLKRDDGREYPTWEEHTIEDVVKFSKGSGLCWDDIDEQGEYPCILYGNLYTDYGIVATEIKRKTNNIPNKPVRSEKGDVLIPASDTTPTGLARATCIMCDDVLLGGDINILKPQKHEGRYFAYAINANKKKLIPKIQGTSVKHIRNNDIADIALLLSNDIEEQKRIADGLDKMEEKIRIEKQILAEWQLIKQALLQQMFV